MLARANPGLPVCIQNHVGQVLYRSSLLQLLRSFFRRLNRAHVRTVRADQRNEPIRVQRSCSQVQPNHGLAAGERYAQGRAGQLVSGWLRTAGLNYNDFQKIILLGNNEAVPQSVREQPVRLVPVQDRTDGRV